MTPQEIEDLVRGPAPDRSESREVPESALEPDECDAQIAYGTGGTARYCGAPKVTGYLACRFHLFHALVEGYTLSGLSTEQ